VGVSIWDWASSDTKTGEPDIVMACCGDVPTLETLAAVSMVRELLPELKVRVVNVVDLLSLQRKDIHCHGLTDREFDDIFTTDKPVVFNFHGYPTLIHRLIYNRSNYSSFHVRGFMEEGTTTTPFDMCVMNKIDRFHLVLDAIEYTGLKSKAAYISQMMRNNLSDHKTYIEANGDDMPSVKNWKWK
jgi:xylulose-5-phosphate/fructose-6-phosphate phosphoketolase